MTGLHIIVPLSPKGMVNSYLFLPILNVSGISCEDSTHPLPGIGKA